MHETAEFRLQLVLLLAFLVRWTEEVTLKIRGTPEKRDESFLADVHGVQIECNDMTAFVKELKSFINACFKNK